MYRGCVYRRRSSVATACTRAACADGDCTNEARSVLTIGQAIAQTAGNKIAGVYQFIAKSGQPYIGRSVDILRRIGQHASIGRVDPNEIQNAKVIIENTGIWVYT